VGDENVQITGTGKEYGRKERGDKVAKGVMERRKGDSYEDTKEIMSC
jgi:hypothetical protein